MYALTAKAMRYMDEYTISKGIPSAVLMENAAGGLVNEIISRFPDKDTEFLVVVGHGNNGADGLCVARWLIHLGYVVNVYFVGERSKVSRAFTDQLRILTSMSKSFRMYGLGSRDDLKILQQRYDVIIDGIFGIGLNRRFGANFAKFIEYLNTKSGFKVAIDIPSGLNGTTGGIMDAVFKADLTVTFGNYKTGMFFGDGRAVSGEVKLIDVGIIKSGYSTIEDKLFICDKKFLDDTRHLALVPREERSHKGTFGSVGIVVGPNAMMGA
ncbi:NAD(P)H-hydrate epimerase, partial [Mogibacterium diversum]